MTRNMWSLASWLLLVLMAAPSVHAANDPVLPLLKAFDAPIAGTTLPSEAIGSGSATPTTTPATTPATPTATPVTAVPVTTTPSTTAIPDNNRLAPRSTLLITYQSSDPAVEAPASVAQILDRKLYTLDKHGILTLPALGSIPLAGLTGAEAAQRLQSETALTGVTLSIQILPVAPQGAEALEPFGYDLFAAAPATTTDTGLPVPPDYRIGAGDSVDLQLFGKVNEHHLLTVARDGTITLSQLGAIPVAGMTFEELRASLTARITQQMIGVTAHIAMGTLRTITVFVTGEVNTPGAWTVSSLSTLTNALALSGGVKKSGSLRNIQLKRGGATVAHLDLYDLLMHGNASADARLQSNDVILVPALGPTASVTGEVVRPAIYELSGQTTIGGLLALAGGLRPEAQLDKAVLQRIENGNRRTLVDVDLSAQKTRAMPVRSGDSLSIPTVSERIEARIMLSGHVKHPADFQWRRGMTARDVLPSADAFLPQADLDYLLVKRQDPATGALSATSFAYAASTGGIRTASEVILEPHDEIVVFQRGRSTDRSTRLAPLLQQLRDQARAGSPARVVSVNGAVPLPGEYPLEAGMRVSDLLRASGGLAEMASTGSAELTRYLAPDGRQTSPSRASIDLAGILSGNTAADVVLEPYDFLVVRAVPQWNTGGTITLAGEVRSPGTYPIARGEKLSSVIARAGGLTDLAFARGAILLREDLKAREARQLEKLAERMEALLASAATNKLTNPDQEESLGVGSQLLTDLKSTQPTGRLVIDLPGILEQTSGGGTSDADITVVSGDYLYIPPPIEDVTVMGEVFHPNSHVWKKGVTTAQLVAMSGGMTEKADDDRVYVIRADGSVLADGLHDSGGRWDWPSTDTTSIRPGDTVIVPIQVDRMQPLTLWSTVTRMVFDLGVTIAQLERAFND